MSTDYMVKITRDGRHHYAYTVVTPNKQIAVREGGFSKRDAAEAALKDLQVSRQPTPEELEDLDNQGAFIPPWFPQSAYEAIP